MSSEMNECALCHQLVIPNCEKSKICFPCFKDPNKEDEKISFFQNMISNRSDLPEKERIERGRKLAINILARSLGRRPVMTNQHLESIEQNPESIDHHSESPNHNKTYSNVMNIFICGPDDYISMIPLSLHNSNF